MRRLQLLLVAALSLALTVAFVVGGSASAARRGRAVVVCKFKVKRGKRLVICPKRRLRGRRGKPGAPGGAGPAGPAGAAGPAGPPGASGGSGSNLNLNFNAYLTANRTRELTIGNFTITAASTSAGSCEPIRVRAGATDSRIAVGAGQEFSFIPNNTNKAVTNGKNSNMFTAISENGASTMSGIVGAVTAGGVCLVSGYVTGL